MKLLLTSGGISNPSIRNALVDLLGKPIAEANALIIPTAAYGCAGWGPGIAWRLISGTQQNPLCELGWKSLGVLELTALPSLDERDWVPSVRETDALLVGGGDPLYLRNWMRQSGLAELFASLRPEFVYVGLSAGSMAVTSHFGEAYTSRKPRGGGDFTLEELDYVTLEGQPGVVNFVSAPGIGLVDFTLFPHLGDAAKPDASLDQCRTVGGSGTGADVRDRRSDRHQSHGRRCRSRFRGPLETIHLRNGGGSRRPVGSPLGR
jgi:dipeptidase E